MKFGLGLVLGLLVASGAASADPAAPAAPATTQTAAAAPLPITGGMEFQSGKEGVDLFIGNFGIGLDQNASGHGNEASLRYLYEIPVANGFKARLGAELGTDTHLNSSRAKDYYAAWSQGVGFEVQKVDFFTDIVVRQTWNVAQSDFAQGVSLTPRVGISYKFQ